MTLRPGEVTLHGFAGLFLTHPDVRHLDARRTRTLKDWTGPTGCEDISPEDTFDGDCGRTLERAYEANVKVLASPKAGVQRRQVMADEPDYLEGVVAA